MAFTKITAAGIGTTESVTLDGLSVINNGSFGGNLTVGGVLTYEDVTNVDSVGLITARNGIVVGSGITLSKDGDIFATGITTVSGNVKVGTGITLSPDGDIFTTGISTFGGNIQLSSTDPEIELNNGGPRFRVPASNTLTIHTGSGLGSANEERLRFTSDGKLQVPIGSDIEIGQIASSNHADGNAGSVLLGIQDGGGAMSGVKVTNVDAGTYNDQIITFLTAQGGVSTPTERLRIASDGAITAQKSATFGNTSDSFTAVQITSSTSGISELRFGDTTANAGHVKYEHSNNALILATDTNERVRITSAGLFGIGVSPSYQLHVKAGSVDQTARFDNAKTNDGTINYIGVCLGNAGTTGTGLFGMTGHSTVGSQACWIGMAGDDVAGGYGLKVFRGGNSVAMQRFAVGTQDHSGFVSGTDASMIISYSKTYRFALYIRPSDNDTGGGQPALFANQAGTAIGSITSNASNVAFNTSSDYRLKENDISIIDGITRLKKLRPIKFNWKTDTEKTVDGFFAHEVSSSVPEAVMGEKDAVNEDGSIKPQQLDYSKLVPLLTAALQEEIAKRESLEARLDAAGL